MRKRLLATLAVSLVLTGTQASAQLAGLLGKSFGLPAKGEAGGSYQSKNQIRTYITSDPYGNAQLYQKLVEKALDMAGEKGFPRIGVTKANCMTALVSGSPRSTSCYVIAIMLHDGETTEPRGNRKVQYYSGEDLRRGVIAPPAE